MKTCTKCKETKLIEKFSKGQYWCKDCQSEYNKTWSEANKERKAANKKAWDEANKEHKAAYSKIWEAENREKRAASYRIWYENNREKKMAVNKLWTENNKERRAASKKIWRDANRDKIRIYEQERRALLIGATATLTEEEWQEIWEEFEGNCFWCGEVATTMEHIVPLKPRLEELQGHHTKSNVVPSCWPCNHSKNNMDPLQFYFKQQEKLNTVEEQEL